VSSSIFSFLDRQKFSTFGRGRNVSECDWSEVHYRQHVGVRQGAELLAVSVLEILCSPSGEQRIKVSIDIEVIGAIGVRE
jgi:hypothetical protein